MGIFNFFRKKTTSNKNNTLINNTPSDRFPKEYNQILLFNKEFNQLLSVDKFIARSDYKHLIDTNNDLFLFIETLYNSCVLDDYVNKHTLNIDQINYFYKIYNEIKDLSIESSSIRNHNEQYISNQLITEKDYLDNILKKCDPQISLDKEQREVVLSNEDNTLVIAGAGAGKTTTIAAKVRYLVEKQNINPERILVISFTNKAVEELRERINECLNIPCPISTFHSVGYSILKGGSHSRKRIVDQGFMYSTINNYLKSSVLQNPSMVEKLILFFGTYFSAPYEGDQLSEYFQFIATADFSTLKSNLHEYIQQIIDRKTQQAQTLNNEVVRSIEEVQIANFLHLNQIDYEYEPIYQYHILDSNKPYTPDFRIKQDNRVAYIEHFGITEDGHNNRFSKDELSKYKKQINDKVKLHRKHNTTLIYTFSKYNDGISFLEHLREQLIKNGFILNKRPIEEVYKRLINSEENKYITRLTLLICNFIGNFKTQGYNSDYFYDLKIKNKNIRTKLFLDICRICYLEYQQALEENNCIDFEDMINVSAELIRKHQISGEKINYKYIIVDEYQDISRQRYNLIKELSLICDAKIMAVGDDWQSIYAFSGSILPLFTKFCQEVGYGQELKITRTYRNAQELINIAGTFVQKNTTQIRKKLISPKSITNPVIISSYNEKNITSGSNAVIGYAVNNAIEQILQFNKKEGNNNVASILLIGRYGFDARKLAFCKDFNYDEKSGKIYSSKFGTRVKLSFLTAHSSKGLSADNVIIINAKDATYGFPSKVEDDPVLQLVTNNDQSYSYAEERRLFYVALTRTKNRVIIVAPENKPSEFIKELLTDSKNYPNVTLVGKVALDSTSNIVIKDRCPICGYPMQYRWKKNFGLRLWICTNDQEVCGFITNDKRGKELCIQKCDSCQDGFLVVKSADKNYFLGCTNYKADKSGCGRSLNLDQYKKWKTYGFTENSSLLNLNSYQNSKCAQISDIPLTKPKNSLPRKKAEVHKVIEENIQIQNDEFNTLISTNNTAITDKKLLHKLRYLRDKLAKEENLPKYFIMNNSTLTSLATERPTTKSEFMSIKGIGEHKYSKYGKIFIKVISDHLNNK
ncbi:MAG: UvrD-helicase domain-containing protein [Muribaculaceae bacterium]|nr:UvrD-helicase domain-containing protein [Muribaculaceae bacterium]